MAPATTTLPDTLLNGLQLLPFAIDPEGALLNSWGMHSIVSPSFRRAFRIALILWTAGGLCSTAHGLVRVPGLFSDHMVLQQGRRVPVWGTANNDEVIVVTFRGQTKQTTTKNGHWSVWLDALKAGGPDTLKITGENSLVFQDVLVGEVWICSGQSNMEWPLSRSYQPAPEIAGAANPSLRLFTVPKLKAEAPTDEVKAVWQRCEPETVPNFSAVAYYFGRDLQKARNVPVGLIHTSWGGSPAEVWIRRTVLEANPQYARHILGGYETNFHQYQDNLRRFQEEEAEAKKAGRALQRNRPGAPWRPTELYNGMIAPIIPYAIAGAIWYQGESNAGRAQQYQNLFRDMIQNWRRDWGQGDFPFLAVQLAPFKAIREEPGESDWAELREAQLLATKTLPNVGIAVITDVGDEKDIHPSKKEPVGARLALAARGIAYREKIPFSGPVFKSMKIENGEAVLAFDHTNGGLEAREGELTGFTIAGADRKFVRAKARIVGDKVQVSHPGGKAPEAVRFGWADFPVVNLWNKAGLPASPFRTDHYPMITEGKH